MILFIYLVLDNILFAAIWLTLKTYIHVYSSKFYFMLIHVLHFIVLILFIRQVFYALFIFSLWSRHIQQTGLFFLMNTLSRWDLLPFYCRCTVRPELGSLDTIPCRWLITLSRRCKNPLQWNPFKLLNHVNRAKYMVFRCS